MTPLECVISVLDEMKAPDGHWCGDTWESIGYPDGYEKPPKEEFETK